MTRITHNNLLSFMEAFGFKNNDGSSITFDGVCFGFSLMLAQALMLGPKEAEHFYQRLDKLNFYSSAPGDLVKDLEAIKEGTPKIKGPFTKDELLDMTAFLETLLLAQAISYQKILSTEIASLQQEIDKVAPLIESAELKKQGGMKVLAEGYSVSTLQEIENYFNALEKVFNEYKQTPSLIFGGVRHAILIHYDLKKEGLDEKNASDKKNWHYVNTNELEDKKHRTYYHPLNVRELVESLKRTYGAGPEIECNFQWVGLAKSSDQFVAALEKINEEHLQVTGEKFRELIAKQITTWCPRIVEYLLKNNILTKSNVNAARKYTAINGYKLNNLIEHLSKNNLLNQVTFDHLIQYPAQIKTLTSSKFQDIRWDLFFKTLNAGFDIESSMSAVKNSIISEAGFMTPFNLKEYLTTLEQIADKHQETMLMSFAESDHDIFCQYNPLKKTWHMVNKTENYSSLSTDELLEKGKFDTTAALHISLLGNSNLSSYVDLNQVNDNFNALEKSILGQETPKKCIQQVKWLEEMNIPAEEIKKIAKQPSLLHFVFQGILLSDIEWKNFFRGSAAGFDLKRSVDLFEKIGIPRSANRFFAIEVKNNADFTNALNACEFLHDTVSNAQLRQSYLTCILNAMKKDVKIDKIMYDLNQCQLLSPSNLDKLINDPPLIKIIYEKCLQPIHEHSEEEITLEEKQLLFDAVSNAKRFSRQTNMKSTIAEIRQVNENEEKERLSKGTDWEWS